MMQLCGIVTAVQRSYKIEASYDPPIASDVTIKLRSWRSQALRKNDSNEKNAQPATCTFFIRHIVGYSVTNQTKSSPCYPFTEGD